MRYLNGRPITLALDARRAVAPEQLEIDDEGEG
jgi:hypothetical protein